MQSRIFHIILFFFLQGFSSYSQTPYSYVYDKNQGLKSNSIYDIFQDSKNQLWLATGKGLCMYNGVEFAYFTSKTQTMRSGSCIKEDDKGRIWYINFDGFLYYVENQQLKKFPQKSNIGFLNFGIIGQKLYLPLEKTIHVYDLNTFQLINEIELDSKIKFSLQQGSDFYVITKKLVKIGQNASKQYFNLEKDTDKEFLAPILCFHKNDMFLISKFTKQILKFDGANFEELQLPFTIDFIQNIKSDQENLWICTTKGVYKYQPEKNFAPHYYEEVNISDVFMDNTNNYWIGTLGEGLYYVPEFYTTFEKTSFFPTKIASLNQQKIIGTNKDEILVNDNTVYRSDIKHPVNLVIADSINSRILWASSKLYVYDVKKNKLVTEKIIAIKDVIQLDHKYYAYAASGTSGLFCIESSLKSKWDEFFHFHASTKYHEKNWLHVKDDCNGKSVAVNDKNQLYIATNKGLFLFHNKNTSELKWNHSPLYLSSLKTVGSIVYGLSTNDILYQIKNNRVEEWTFGNKITNNNCQRIFQCKHYIYLYDGITLFEIDTYQNKVVKIFNSLNLEVQDVLIQDNELIIVTNKGFIKKQKNTAVKNYYSTFKLTKVTANHQSYHIEKDIEVNANPEFVKIYFDYINFSPFDNHEAAYKINNGKWLPLNVKEHYLQFLSLAPGNYKVTFKIQGKEVQEISFTVLKPWYLRWYSILTYIILIFVVLAQILKIQSQKNEKKNKTILERIQLEKNLNQSTLKAIKSQMNPHFFYNALNTIQAFILANDKKQAVNYLSKFSSLTRNILELTEKEQVTIAEEIDTLQLYLDIEKARFDEDFEFEINTINLEAVDQIKIPAMLLQPYVENAVKHGLLHKSGQKKLTISFEKIENWIEIIIDDNGIGREKSAALNQIKNKNHQSFATKAMENRIQLLNQNKTEKITIAFIDKINQSQQATGTTVKITIPVE